MFDFGKDLQRFVLGGGRAGVRDARLLELLAPELLAQQAHAETAMAERAARPAEGWRDVSRLWLEHARRTGSAASLDAAERAAERCLGTGDGSARGLSLLAHFESFNRGMIDTFDLAYLVLFSLFFLALSVQRLGSERLGTTA